MGWIAVLKNGEVIESDHLVSFSKKIKNHLDDVALLGTTLQDASYSVSFKDGSFNINGLILRTEAFKRLHNVRPIWFRRECVQLSTGTLQTSKATVAAMGLGYQGNDEIGRNHKNILLIYPDGSIEME